MFEKIYTIVCENCSTANIFLHDVAIFINSILEFPNNNAFSLHWVHHDVKLMYA